MTTKKGFAAYEEINALAREVYGPGVAAVEASIFGDDYIIRNWQHVELMRGSSDYVRGRLESMRGAA